MMGHANLPEFFKGNEYFIDEKIGFLKFSNAYKVYDEKGQQIGNIQQSVPGWHKLLRLFLSKAIFPFTLHVKEMDGTVVATIQRGWTFWMSKIVILDGQGNQIGGIKHKFKLFKPLFHIVDTQQNVLAEIKGDWKAWEFKIVDSSDNSIGHISKKWAGVLKEVFTTADKYRVTVDNNCPPGLAKIAIVAGAITIDMILKESK